MVAVDLGVSARHGRQVWSHIVDRLDTGFFIDRDGDDLSRLFVSIFVAEVDFTVYHENLMHLFVKLFVPSLKVVAYLMGLEGLRLENSKDRCFGCLPEAWVARIRAVFAGVFGQTGECPHLGCIAMIRWLGAGKIDNPQPCFRRDRWLS